MGLQIEDGKGSGQQVEVKNNKLLVSGVVSTPEHYANHNQGNAYNLNFSATPTIGGCFLYFKNEGTLALNIEGIWLMNAADDYIEIKLNDQGTPLSGTAITPVNLNTTSGKAALGTFQHGATITGLSGGDITHKLHHANSAASKYENFNQDIVLGSNGVLSLYAGTGTTLIEGIVVFNYHGTNN